MSAADTSSANAEMKGVDPFVLSALDDMRKKLLDLTTRNRLLNFPIDNKSSALRIVDELPNQIYETLIDEIAMEFAPVPEPTREQLLDHGYLKVDLDGNDVQHKTHPTAKDWAGILGISTGFELPLGFDLEQNSMDKRVLLEQAREFILRYAQDQGGKLTGIRSHYVKEGFSLSKLTEACTWFGYNDIDEFERQAKAGNPLKFFAANQKHGDNKIQVMLFPGELEARLRNLHNKAQTAIEESGANILYLALGFLEWYESDISDKPRLAPLFTIPVNLERGKLDVKEGIYKYQLNYSGEDILPNLSLKEKLQADFGLGLPPFEDEQTPEEYLTAVTNIISLHKPKWSVRRYGALSLLNFGKMMMYLDLDPSKWPKDQRNILNHEIVRRFFTSQSGDGFSGTGEVEYPIDGYPRIHDQIPLIDDADSSQHSAIIDVIQGKNLVIEGPPGTGKSQTITNLIAAALLNGKKVLFIAEKMAALEVVKRRLDRAGLGDFCLELHSHKSHKRKVLEDIQSRLDYSKSMPTSAEIDAQITLYE